MLRSMRDLENYSIRANDGDIGRVKDFYADDGTWVIRHLIVDTSVWMGNRKVLISPRCMGRPDWGGRILPVKITKERVRNSPDIDIDKPVSRQHERGYLGHYDYPYYWSGAGILDESAYPYAVLKGGGDVNSDGPYGNGHERAQSGSREDQQGGLHLRSCKEIIGFHIHASDGDIGHVHDVLVDERAWTIPYIVVNTNNWFGGHRVLIVPHRIRDVSSTKHMVSVDLTRQQLKDAPLYNAEEAFCRQEEESICRHYGRNGHWNSVPKDQVRPPSR